ncbi:MAG: cytidylate kinase family protein [Candidatus Bilamarchaeaceae archaeon]
MIIAVSGLAGSGKNTFGMALAKALGYRVVCPTFKDLAAAEGISLLEFQERAKKDPEIDRKFDNALKKEASSGNCVVTTWLGPWMIDADYRIWVMVPEKIRAERVAARDGISFRKALEHIRKRDSGNRERYLKLYGIDISNIEGFDLALNAGSYTPEEMVKVALEGLKQKGRGKR